MLKNLDTNRFLLAGLFVGAASAAALSAQAGYVDEVLADNPLYYWDMDTFTSGNVSNLGTAGNSAENQLGNQNGGVSFVAGGTTGGGDSLGNAADFSGVNLRLLAGSQNGQGGMTGGALTQYVIEFWMSSTDAISNQYIMWHGPNNAPAVLVGYNDNSLEIFSGTRTGADGPDVTDGGWHHIVIGVDSTTAGHLIYVDGVLHSSQPEAIVAWNNPGNEGLTLGGSNAANVDIYNGQLDEFAVYDASGSDIATFTADIADHYNAVPEPGSLALLGLSGLAVLHRRRSR